MRARMVKDDYIDLAPKYPYEVERIYSNGYIKLKHSPRRYRLSSFELTYKGKPIEKQEAYRLDVLERTKRKLGFKK